jgi:thymidylate synthase ThyX
MISAEIILDSISPAGARLTTFKLRYPKFIHGEFMTHRVISRNASSSRAVPTSKLIEEVLNDNLRASPVFWGANQKGMQAAEELSDTNIAQGWLVSDRVRAQKLWGEAAYEAADKATKMLKLGVHKQIVNRLLEPFSHINVVASATEWDNFFGLRLHKDAQPEMRVLAEEMWKARRQSIPQQMQPDEWHLPFVSGTDWSIRQIEMMEGPNYSFEALREDMKRVSVARCARVSYESFETGKRSTIEEDLALYARLLGAQPLHASPAEHQATPDAHTQYMEWLSRKEWGNFVGWRQLRKMLPGEGCAPLPEGYA